MNRLAARAMVIALILTNSVVLSQEDTKLIDARKEAAQSSRELLRARWIQFAAENKVRSLSKPAETKATLVDDRFRLPTERRELAATSTASFVEPKTVQSAAGVLTTTLIVDKAHLTIGSDPVFLRCYNGTLVGPTLRAKPGDVLKITIDNRLPPNLPGSHANNTLHDYNTTNLHTHGLHVSPSGNSDNVLLDILPGTKQDYEIRIPANHPAGTFWYHAHRHGSVAAQVSSGMSGAIVVEGGAGTLDAVPEIAACTQRVMILQQIPYYNRGLTEGIIEETVAADLFGPGTWNNSSRFTTVNGVVLPVITMKPGEIERWRIVDSGFRERIDLRLQRSTGSGPADLQFHKLAADGLPLGKLDSKPDLELWPGYRWDVLVQAPNATGDYLLVDEAVPAGSTMTGDGKNRKYIARIVVKGTAKSMTLPSSASLAGFRLPSIPASQVTGTQSATYGINVPPLAFQIDGKSYDPTAAPRKLKLNDVDEWTLKSINNVGLVNHPFHIHVNAFEVFEVVDNATGVNEIAGDPIWRDTIIMRPGKTIKFRTRYEDFTGDFVQHCHILDHEDQGMMELIRIEGPALKGAAPPAKPKVLNLESTTSGRPAVYFFVQGSSCPHCVTQLTTAAAKLADQKVDVTVVSASSTEDLERFPKLPFQFVADPQHALFKKHGVFDGGPKHGVIVRSAAGKELLRKVTDTPFMDLATVLTSLKQGPSYVIEVRKTAADTDDYITWAPTVCQIRIVNGVAGGDDVKVTLTNDLATAIPDGGDVFFATTIKSGQTATSETISLSLKQDGTPVEFFIAGKKHGKLTKTSLANLGRDAVIDIHQGDQNGQTLGSHAVMVRVRRNASGLNELERKEFLSAIAAVKASGEYERLVALHTIATGRSFGATWPDQAHGDAGFIPWHRAFLMLYERELQKTHPHVALHYWREDLVSSVFQANFLGANTIRPGFQLENVNFGLASDGNPLFGWEINGVFLRRWAINRANTSWCDPESTVLAPSEYRSSSNSFSGGLEQNPHNDGHGWVGGWMQGCQTSPRDPIFFLFHCDIDRLWAKWQWTHGRFGFDGTDPKDYFPNDKYAVGSTIPLGHHLKDTMWPWDSVTGPGVAGDPFDDRPDATVGIEGPFPASVFPGVWPPTPGKPEVSTMIDYLGVAASGIDLGFCYDDVPFGKKDVKKNGVIELVQPDHLGIVKNEKSSWSERKKALSQLQRPLTINEQKVLLQIFRDPREADTIRALALSALVRTSHEGWVDAAIEVLVEPDKSEAELRTQIVNRLGTVAMFSKSRHQETAKIDNALRAVASAKETPAVRMAALSVLAAMEDKTTLDQLRAAVRNKTTDVVSREQAVQLIAVAEPGKNHEVLRPLIAREEPEGVRVTALLSLGADATSIEGRRAIAKAAAESTTIREAAIRSLMHRDPDFLDLATAIVKDSKQTQRIRSTALAGMNVHLQYRKGKIDRDVLALVKGELAKIETTEPAFRGQLERTVQAIDVLLKSGKK